MAAGDEASLRKALELSPATTTPSSPSAELLAERQGHGDARRRWRCSSASPRRPRPAGSPRWPARAATTVVDDDIAAKLDALLDRVKADDEARQEFVDLLEVLGPDDPRTAAYRKELTARLF